MFFPLSKVIFFLITPSNFFALVGLAGVALTLATTRRRLGAGLSAFGLLGLLAGGLSPLSAWAVLPLEQRFPAFADDAPPDGIIVLGGGIEAGLSAGRKQVVVNDAGERPIYMADLARRYPQARLMFSGGSGSLVDGAIAEADIVSRDADTLGLPRTRLILENRSRNTRENALFSAAMAQPKPGERWLLVTSAFHMPRAIGCFRAAGFDVVAFPVDYRTRGPRDALRFGSFASEGLLVLDLAVKEWIGLAVYRLAGYTDALLPGPADQSSGSDSR